MRKTIAILAAAHLAAGAAHAGDLRSSLAGRLVPAQAHAVGIAAAEPPAPERAGRAVVVQAPLPLPTNPAAEAAASADATTAIPVPAPAPVTVPPPPAPPAVTQAQPNPAPVQAAPAQPHNPAAPAVPQTLPAPVAPDAALPGFAMSGEQLATIGVGVIGGLIILDSIGVPTAAAAFVGGLAGQWWYSVNHGPSDDYVVTRRVTNRLWQDAAIRDGEAMNRRWLRPVRDGRDG